MLAIFAVNLHNPLPEAIFQLCLAKMPEEKQKKIKAFYRREDATRALIGQVLLRTIIMDTLKIPNNAITFEHNAYGKPALSNSSNFHFNISHASDWVVIAVDSLPVGIDVERIKDMDFDIARRFFSVKEYNDLMSKPEALRQDYFFDLWTLKESYIKAIGKGLSQPLDSFSMVFEKGIIRIIKNDMHDKNEWFFKQYPAAAGYKLAVCAAVNQFPEQIVNKSSAELYNDFIRLHDQW